MERDERLDVAKAIAIIFVVVGHQIQVSNPHFDQSLGFRVIYSFHMPLFMFLAGMSATFWVERNLEACGARTISRDLLNKALRLLLPFFVWGLISTLFSNGLSIEKGLAFLRTLILSPDNGLWFLPALFDIWLILYAILALRRFLRAPVLPYMLIAGIIVHLALARAPNAYALGFARSYFQWFYLGLLVTLIAKGRWHWAITVCAGVGFALLVPFWWRIEEDEPAFAMGKVVNYVYREGVALTGVILAAGVSLWLGEALKGWIREAFSFVGQRTLDIYAVHQYLLALVFPPVIGPLLGSLLFSQIVRFSPLLTSILFGERLRGRPTLVRVPWNRWEHHEDLPSEDA